MMENEINLLSELYDIKRQNIDWEIKLENNHLLSDGLNHRVNGLAENQFEITLSCDRKTINHSFNTKDLPTVDTNGHSVPEEDINCVNGSDFTSDPKTTSHSMSNTITSAPNQALKTTYDGIKNVEQYVERRKVNGITWYYCKFGQGCVYGSNKSNHLVRHIRSHTGERPFPCDYPNCDKKFSDSWKLKDHKMSHNRKVRPITVDQLSDVHNKSDNNLKLFVEMLNTNNNICEPIDNDMESKPVFNQNLDDIDEDNCSDDDLNMFIPEVIFNEMDSSEDTVTLNCDNFVSTEDSLNALVPQIHKTVPKDTEWFRCGVVSKNGIKCNYGSNKNHYLIRHIKAAHHMEKHYMCEWPECLKRFSDAYKLKEHKLTHYRKLITTVGPNNKTSMDLIFDLNKNDDKFENKIIISEANREDTNRQNASFRRMTFNVSDEQTAQLLSPKKVVMSIKSVEQYVERMKVDGMTRYYCRWPSGCAYSSNKSNHLVRHINSHKSSGGQLCPKVNVESSSTNDVSLLVAEDNRQIPQTYTPNPNSILLQSLCSPPLRMASSLQLSKNDKPIVRTKSPADVVMSIKNVEQYVERRKFYFCKWLGCNYGSNKSNHLVRHVRSHTGEKPYACDECDKRFTDSWKLKDHKSIHERKSLKINKSNELSLVKGTSSQSHSTPGSVSEQSFYSCNSYQNNTNIFASEEDINNSNQRMMDLEDNDSNDIQEMDLLVPQVIIDESDEMFVSLKNESEELKDNESKRFNETSNHGILSIKNVEQFVDRVVSSGVNTYFCKWNGCSFRTQKSSYIVQHVYRHQGFSPYKCNFNGCDAKFNKKQELSLHKLSHSGDKPFRCHYPNCYYMAIDSDALKVHFEKHRGEKAFRCSWNGEECSAQFATNIELLRHIKSHSGARLHKCHFPECQYVSKYRNKLTIHIRRHTNTLPFKCDFENCGKSFIVRDKLKRHQNSVHLKTCLQQSIQQIDI